MEYIKVLNTGKICICIDETDLEYTDGRFMRWCRRDLPNSKPSMLVYPRISIILALSTRGEIYISISQSNNNSVMMDLFIRQLSKKLDKERQNWRENTFWLWDG